MELLPGVDMDEMRMTVRENIVAVVKTVFFKKISVMKTVFFLGDDETTSGTLAWGRPGGD